MVRKRRSTGPRTWSPAGYSGSPAPKARAATASRCCATRTVTAFPMFEPSSWTTSTRPLASPWSARISTWRTPTPSSDILITKAKPASRTPGIKLTDLPGGPIDHHWTKSSAGQPGRLQALCRGRLKQQHHRKRNPGRIRTRRCLGGRPGIGRPSHLRQRPAQSHRPGMGARDQQTLGRRQRTR